MGSNYRSANLKLHDLCKIHNFSEPQYEIRITQASSDVEILNPPTIRRIA